MITWISLLFSLNYEIFLNREEYHDIAMSLCGELRNGKVSLGKLKNKEWNECQYWQHWNILNVVYMFQDVCYIALDLFNKWNSLRSIIWSI